MKKKKVGIKEKIKSYCCDTCREEINSEETAALYAKHIFQSHGLSTKNISDRDPPFALRFIRELCNILEIKQNMSTAYHPCTDGQSKQTNQWLEQYLCFWTNECQDNWVAYPPIAESLTIIGQMRPCTSPLPSDGIQPTC